MLHLLNAKYCVRGTEKAIYTVLIKYFFSIRTKRLFAITMDTNSPFMNQVAILANIANID